MSENNFWKIIYTKAAKKDRELLKQTPLFTKAEKLIKETKQNPYSLPYEKLTGDLRGMYSKRINIQHRIVYMVHENEHTIQIISMWNHYE